MQEEKLSLSEFFGCWLTCIIKTKKLNTVLAKNLFSCMQEREKILFDNDVLLSAIFLDPRYKIVLSETQVQKSIQHLQLLWRHMNVVSKMALDYNSNAESIEESQINDCDVTSSSRNTDDGIEEYLKAEELLKNQIDETTQSLKQIEENIVSVERLFSSLKFILSHLHSNLSSTMLENILLIRQNKLFEAKD